MALRPVLLPPGLRRDPDGTVRPAPPAASAGSGPVPLAEPLQDAATGQTWTMEQLARGLGQVYALIPGALGPG